MTISSRSKSPPGGWRFRHPISGLELAFHSWTQLRGAVDRHCEGNGYPPISDAEIEEQLCSRLGVEMSRWCEGPGISVKAGLHWSDILRGTQIMAEFLLKGRPVVDQSEANRRAAICRVCPRNSWYSKPCGGLCGEIESFVKSIIGEATTPDDAFLESCTACKCHLPSKVWMPMDIMQRADTEEVKADYHKKCWMLPENSV